MLADLADRGVTVSVRLGRLDVRPASLLTANDVAQLRAHKPDLVVLALACDERTLDRLLDLRRSPRMMPDARVPGRCYVCAEPLPRARLRGCCGWCGLARRLYAGAPLTPNVLGLFDVAIVGPLGDAINRHATHVLDFDRARVAG